MLIEGWMWDSKLHRAITKQLHRISLHAQCPRSRHVVHTVSSVQVQLLVARNHPQCHCQSRGQWQRPESDQSRVAVAPVAWAAASSLVMYSSTRDISQAKEEREKESLSIARLHLLPHAPTPCHHSFSSEIPISFPCNKEKMCIFFSFELPTKRQ